jgi:N-formylglutamate amidohydrolase
MKFTVTDRRGAHGRWGKTVYGEAMTPVAGLDPIEMAPPPFVIHPAIAERGVLVFASPHSGGWTPADMDAAQGLSAAALRSAEDVGVDRLIATGPAVGVPLITALVSRAYVDLNRGPEELDAVLIDDVAGSASAKVAAGYGVIPRRAGDGTALYDRRLSSQEAQRRIARVHHPYHQALAELMGETRERAGTALLVDWHSMPSRAAGARGGRRPSRGVDIVLGDRHGASARGGVTRRIRALFEAEGLSVALNTPYAGGFATQTWGRPDEGFQAVQIEINRALYLNEATLEPSSDHDRFAACLTRVIVAFAKEPWR